MVYKPNKPAETLWEGTFHNSPSVEEMEQFRSEVRSKAQELNIKLSDDGLSGWKYEEDVKE